MNPESARVTGSGGLIGPEVTAGSKRQLRFVPVLVPLVMIAFAAVSTATLLKDEIFRYVHRTRYIVGVPDKDLMSLRSIIPKGEALGYITDASDPEAADKRLYGVTYSLAPLIVENTANRRFILGDFRNKASIPIALRQHRLHVVEDLGDGFLLLTAQ